jgi:hypothetical protein
VGGLCRQRKVSDRGLDLLLWRAGRRAASALNIFTTVELTGNFNSLFIP